MGFLTDPRYAQTVAPDQVGQVARGNVPPFNHSYDVGGQMVASPVAMSNPAPLAPPHIADQAANIVGQYITDHGNLLRDRLRMAHSLGNFVPPKFGVPDLVNKTYTSMDPGFNRPGLAGLLRNVPSFTRDPGFSNQNALAARLAGGLRASLPALLAQRYGGRH